MDNANLIFLDTETTGLKAGEHELWEIGFIDGEGIEYEYQLPVTLLNAEPTALRISRFYERRADILKSSSKNAHMVDIKNLSVSRVTLPGEDVGEWQSRHRDRMAEEIAVKLSNKSLVGVVPSFDEGMIEAWLQSCGQVGSWHYHLIDVGPMAAGYLKGKDQNKDIKVPWSTYNLTRSVGVSPPTDEEKHTAIGDARWVKRLWDKIMSSAEES